MRIGIDVRIADPGGPGQERYLWRLGSWLAARSHEVHYLTLLSQRDEIRLPESSELHRLHGRSRAQLRSYLSELSLDAILLNPERARRYRGIQANVLRPAYGTEHYRQKLRSFRGRWEHGFRTTMRSMPWEVAERRWERSFYEGGPAAPEVIAQSHYLRREILDSYAIPEDHVHVVHNGVDLSEFTVEARLALREGMRAQWGIEQNATCILVLAHNFRLKGIWRLFQVLGSRTIGGVPVHLLVAGKGTGPGQRREARRRSRRAGLEGRVTFAGPLDRPLRALAAADALVHLSWHDAFGLAPLEAMACGLPVVTTRLAGVSELIEANVSGILVDPSSDEEIAEALRRLQDADRRDSLGIAAVKRAAAHDEAVAFAQVERVLRTAVERGVPFGP